MVCVCVCVCVCVSGGRIFSWGSSFVSLSLSSLLSLSFFFFPFLNTNLLLHFLNCTLWLNTLILIFLAHTMHFSPLHFSLLFFRVGRSCIFVVVVLRNTSSWLHYVLHLNSLYFKRLLTYLIFLIKTSKLSLSLSLSLSLFPFSLHKPSPQSSVLTFPSSFQ